MEKIDKQNKVIERKNIKSPQSAAEDVTTVSTTKPNISTLPVNNADSSSTTANDKTTKVAEAAKESEVTTTNKTIPKLTRPLLKRKNAIETKKSSELISPQKEQTPSAQNQSISPTKSINSPTKSISSPNKSTQSPVQIQQILPSSQIKTPPKDQEHQLSANSVIETTSTSNDKLQPKNDEVSSTNTKDSETNVSNNEPDTKKDEQIVETSETQQADGGVVHQLSDEKMTTETSTVSNDDYVKSSQDTVDSSDKREDDSVSQSQQSQETSSVTTYEEIVYSSEDQHNQPEFETEDSDDDSERLNPKTCVEREERAERLGKLIFFFFSIYF